MSSLIRTSTPDVYRINHPQFAAALTRSNGVATGIMRGRIATALQARGEFALTFKRGDSGKWYVRISSRKAALDIGPVCDWNKSMAAKYGAGNTCDHYGAQS